MKRCPECKKGKLREMKLGEKTVFICDNKRCHWVVG